MPERTRPTGHATFTPLNSDTWKDTLSHRLLGVHEDGTGGPTLVVVACLHGNEISGGDAALRVLHYLKRGRTPFHGRFVALIGNVTAYDARLRFIQEDLNRIWTTDRVDQLGDGPPKSVEAGEMLELRNTFEFLASHNGSAGKYLLDLHTTSAASQPFAALAGDDRAREIVRRIEAIEVRRITEFLAGMLVKHTTDLGWTSIAFEAGSHMQADSVDIHETLIWQAMATAGMVDEDDTPLRIRVRDAEMNRPERTQSVVEVIHHHLIRDGDRFRMKPGFKNFQRVRKGQTLAEDRNGAITSPEDGRIFLPLYQNEGRDGFFIVRDLVPAPQDPS